MSKRHIDSKSLLLYYLGMQKDHLTTSEEKFSKQQRIEANRRLRFRQNDQGESRCEPVRDRKNNSSERRVDFRLEFSRILIESVYLVLQMLISLGYDQFHPLHHLFNSIHHYIKHFPIFI